MQASPQLAPLSPKLDKDKKAAAAAAAAAATAPGKTPSLTKRHSSAAMRDHLDSKGNAEMKDGKHGKETKTEKSEHPGL